MACIDNTDTVSRTPIVPSPWDVALRVRSLFIRRAKRRAIEGLLLCELRELTDMGLTRGDVHEALSMGGDPSANLQRLAALRRGI